MGYPHFHFLGNVDFARNFVEKCVQCTRENSDNQNRRAQL